MDESLPEDDARRMMERASQATVAYDLIPAERESARCTSRTRYCTSWRSARQASLLSQQRSLGALNLVYYAEGDELGWHFDRAEFVVTLMLQPPHRAAIRVLPNLRNESDENYSAVQRLLQGDMTDVIHLPSIPARWPSSAGATRSIA